MRDHSLYLSDILKAFESIESFVEGQSFEDFKKDDKTSSAVIRKFEIIGEAAKQVPENIKQKYPSVPWKEMAGMRDKLIHFYFGVNYELLWQTIKNRIPEIKPVYFKSFRALRNRRTVQDRPCGVCICFCAIFPEVFCFEAIGCLSLVSS